MSGCQTLRRHSTVIVTTRSEEVEVEGINPVTAAIIALVATLFGIVVREGAQLILKLVNGKVADANLGNGNGKYVRKDLCEERHKLVETRLDEAKGQRQAILDTANQTQKDVRMLTQHLLEND